MTGIENARSFLQSIAGFTDEPQAEVPSQDKPVKLGTVDPAYNGTGNPLVLFDGESIMSVKGYPYIGIQPQAGDRVALMPQGHGYVIVGILGTNGKLTVPGVLRLPSTADESATSTGHPFQIGPDSGQNLRIDNNQIDSYNNGVHGPLYLNTDTTGGDGDVGIGTSGSKVSIPGIINAPYTFYKDANGKATSPSGGAQVAPLYYSSTFTVTLPSGRFDVAPDVLVGAAGLGVLYACVVGTPTDSSFTAVVVRLNASLAANSHYLIWHAMQRTATSPRG